MTKPKLTLEQVTDFLGPLVTWKSWADTPSEANATFDDISAPDLAGPRDMIFISNPKHLGRALSSPAFAVCFHESMRAALMAKPRGELPRHFFFSTEPERAMRELLQKFYFQTPFVNTDSTDLRHPTAVIHKDARLAADVRVGPYAVIARGAEIGAGAVVAAHSVIEVDARIGARTVIHPFVYIGHGTELGNDCEVHPHSAIGKEGFGYAHDLKGNHFRIPHRGKVVLEDRVHLGSGVTIDRGTFGETRIRAGAILDNQIHIAHNVDIGQNSIITAKFAVAGSTKIGRNFLTGGNTSVTGHIEICDGVQIAGVSVVRKSIKKPGAYGGNPLLPMREYMRMSLALSKLPLLLKSLGFSKLKGDDKMTEATDEA